MPSPADTSDSSSYLRAMSERYRVSSDFLEEVKSAVEQIFDEFDEARRGPLLEAVEASFRRRAQTEVATVELRQAVTALHQAHEQFVTKTMELREIAAELDGRSRKTLN